METTERRPWPVWTYYLIVVAVLGGLLLADLAGWLAPLDPVRSP